MRVAKVYMQEKLAGYLAENEDGYTFQYTDQYLADQAAQPISLTLPLTTAPYQSSVMFSFFDGLIPEGWLLDIAQKNWKIDRRDRMGLLLACCRDCIGAVSIQENDTND